jgi:AraC-like DNA-binding protein
VKKPAWKPARSNLVIGVSAELPNGHIIAEHSHRWDQLIYASQGVMSVFTPRGSWVVPPQRAVWVPAGVKHKIEISGAVSMRTLYLRVWLMRKFPKDCFVVNVSALLRELILHATTLRILDSKNAAHKRLVGVIVDHLALVSTIPLQLPLPVDSRAMKVADRLRADPASSDSLTQISTTAGASKRTVERLFLLQTGMTFVKWRQQVRLLHALRLLAAGKSVTTTAFDVGYDSTSAFISMFKKTFGVTPGHYFRPK